MQGRELVSTIFLLTVSILALTAGGRSALHEPTAKPLPPQVFDMGPYDDVIELQSEEFNNYLDFAGSQLKPIVKVGVSCYCDTKRKHCPDSVKFEDLWFRQGEPVGSKQHAPLPIPERDQVAILLKPRLKPLTEVEIVSCAGAIVRLRLTCSLNRNLIVVVRVPDRHMDDFVSALRKQNFSPTRRLDKKSMCSFRSHWSRSWEGKR